MSHILKRGLLLSSAILPILTFCAHGQNISFDHQQIIEIEGKAHSISIIDNDDGFSSLLVLTDNFKEAKIFQGGEEGLFEEIAPLNKNENYGLVEIGDLDGDGADDLVFSSYWNNGFKVYWGLGNGAFTEGQHYSLTGHGRSIKAYDMDQDGFQDIVALSAGSGQPITLHVYYGNGDRSFTLEGVFRSGLDTDRQITIVDKNLDGLSDVMVSSSFPWFVIFYQQGDGSFVPRYWPQQIEIPFPSNYYLADLNNDQKVDLIEYFWDGKLRFYVGLEDTLFSNTYVSLTYHAGAARTYILDMNQDGWVDLVTNKYSELTDELTDTLCVLLNKGDFTFEEPTYYTLPGNISYFKVADINGDHFPDVLAHVEDVGIVIAYNSGTRLGPEEPPRSNTTFVFPNPFDSRLNLHLFTMGEIYIYSLQGQLMRQISGSEIEVDTTDWKSGIYLMKVFDGTNVSWSKLVKM